MAGRFSWNIDYQRVENIFLQGVIGVRSVWTNGATIFPGTSNNIYGLKAKERLWVVENPKQLYDFIVKVYGEWSTRTLINVATGYNTTQSIYLHNVWDRISYKVEVERGVATVYKTYGIRTTGIYKTPERAVEEANRINKKTQTKLYKANEANVLWLQ